MNSRVEVLVDSTFLLPTLGVKVAQISDSDLRELAKLRSGVDLFCLDQCLVEILGKVARGIKAGAGVLETIESGLRSLLESGAYTWISPSVGALVKALQLKGKGHGDMIDNMLYATAVEREMLFLSLDESFKQFLSENNYPTNSIVDIKTLRLRL